MTPVSGTRYQQRNGQSTGPLRKIKGVWTDTWNGRWWNPDGTCHDGIFDYDLVWSA